MVKTTKTDQERATIAASKEERARDAALAMRDYQAEKIAVLAKTERLRALRLSREAQEAAEGPKPAAAKPAKAAAVKPAGAKPAARAKKASKKND